MTKLLEYVMERGTGASARWRWHFYRPAGGKTGTTNDYGDAWFVGFTPQITCGVWVGFDQRANMGKANTGAGAALPMWARFMKEAHEALNLPIEDFTMPEGVAQLEVCEDTHLVATPYCPNRYTEYFRADNIPPTCTVHRVDASPSSTPAEADLPTRRSF
jgi:penicillin-binding protein 1A